MVAVNAKSPLYLQLREVVRDRIESGEYAPGCPIPSESSLAKTYGVNRLTVRSALDALVEEGMIKRVQGKGAFVVGTRVERDLDNLTGFHQAIEGSSANPGVRILEKSRRKAGSVYAKHLGIDRDDDIFFIKRLDTVNGTPISVEYIYIPSDLVPNLLDIDLDVFTLYDVYGFYDTVPVRAYQTLDVVHLEPRIARALDVGSCKDALMFTCLSYREDGRAMEFMRSFNRCDTCFFTVRNGIR